MFLLLYFPCFLVICLNKNHLSNFLCESLRYYITIQFVKVPFASDLESTQALALPRATSHFCRSCGDGAFKYICCCPGMTKSSRVVSIMFTEKLKIFYFIFSAFTRSMDRWFYFFIHKLNMRHWTTKQSSKIWTIFFTYCFFSFLSPVYDKRF